MARLRFAPTLTALALSLLPQETIKADISAETRWADPSSVVLDVEFPGEGYHANWELFRCKCGDLLVRSELNVPGEVEKGETVLVEGRAILSRGFGEHQQELGASLDAPALMMQLALRLLERSEPGGPSRITAPAAIDVTEAEQPILLDTQTAMGGFQAPWSIGGKIEQAGGDRRRFDLRFTFSVGPPGQVQQGTMRLNGVADFAATEFPLTPASSLDGWTLNWRDEKDHAATAAAEARTLGELRELIRARP